MARRLAPRPDADPNAQLPSNSRPVLSFDASRAMHGFQDHARPRIDSLPLPAHVGAPVNSEGGELSRLMHRARLIVSSMTYEKDAAASFIQDLQSLVGCAEAAFGGSI